MRPTNVQVVKIKKKDLGRVFDVEVGSETYKRCIGKPLAYEVLGEPVTVPVAGRRQSPPLSPPEKTGPEEKKGGKGSKE